MNDQVSIIIPTYHEEKNIVQTLEHLLTAIKFSSLTTEVVIVDSSTNELTRMAIDTFSKATGLMCEVIALTNKTFAGKARNIGVKHSQYQLLAFVDAGVYVSEDWLFELHKTLVDNNADIVWGKSEHKVTSIWQKAYIRSFYRANYTKRFIRSCMMKKEVFNHLNGFIEHVHAGEDINFYQKVKQAKVVEKFADAQAYYSHYPDNIKQILKKWISFTADNVVAKQAKAKFIFVSLQFVIGLIVLILLINKQDVGWLLLLIAISLRVMFQFSAAKIKVTSLTETLLTIFLIAIFDLARFIGLLLGVWRCVLMK
ncbi:MAG: glycosyltransferase [Erysipelotrichaceae bacterium]|nr:glycosyltransferase [Erysipelotrichaceae bacterium]